MYKRNNKELESVQKFAFKVSSHCWNIDYEMLLNIFQLPSLSARRGITYIRSLQTTLHFLWKDRTYLCRYTLGMENALFSIASHRIYVRSTRVSVDTPSLSLLRVAFHK